MHFSKFFLRLPPYNLAFACEENLAMLLAWEYTMHYKKHFKLIKTLISISSSLHTNDPLIFKYKLFSLYTLSRHVILNEIGES